jgi:hypothetical protein
MVSLSDRSYPFLSLNKIKSGSYSAKNVAIKIVFKNKITYLLNLKIASPGTANQIFF